MVETPGGAGIPGMEVSHLFRFPTHNCYKFLNKENTMSLPGRN